jgi:hypothetical protein
MLARQAALQRSIVGKGSRNKLKRKEPAPKAPLETLHKAFELVERRFGTNTKCVEAAAMLRGIAKHLGYDLQLRPVSVGVNDMASGKSVCMGPKILAGLTPEQREALQTDHLPDGDSMGHVVLTLDTPALLMDPNLRQVNRPGINVPNVFVSIEDATSDPEDGQWVVNGKGFEVTYLLDAGADPLLEDIDQYSAIEEADYQIAAKALRRGLTVELNEE